MKVILRFLNEWTAGKTSETGVWETVTTGAIFLLTGKRDTSSLPENLIWDFLVCLNCLLPRYLTGVENPVLMLETGE